VLINSIGWVVFLDYRKLGVWMPVQVGFFMHYLVGWCHIFTLYVCCMCVSLNRVALCVSRCSELVLSVLKLHVCCSKPVATRVEVCCYVLCKWPCPFVRRLGMSIVGVRALGSCRVLWSVFMRVSKVALGCIVWGSLRWLLLTDSVWIWNFYVVFRCAPFLWQCTISMILFMGPNEWASSIRCCAKLEVVLWLRHAVMCSL